MEAPKRCHSCKGFEFEQGTQREERQVGGFAFAAELTVYRCRECQAELFGLGEVGRFDKEIAGWLAREGVLSGEAFRFMRKAVGLRANELAELLDLTPETLSRWERGQRMPDRKAMVVLGALVLDQLAGQDVTRKRLQALGSLQEGHEPVDLTDSLRAA